MDDLVRSQLVMLVPEAAQYLGLALHELATNAAKYGALATPAGKVQIAWQASGGAGQERRLRFTWHESGSPPANTSNHQGFGQTVLREIVPGMLGGTADLAFAAGGITWTLDAPLDKIETTKLG
jgi:two-component sensor histidine kinase